MIPAASHRRIGAATIALAVAFNIPFAWLGAGFDYPQILRAPAAEVLARFAAGGAGLILVWQAFLLCALALIPLAIALAFSRNGWQQRPILAVGGAITGALAGLAQAIGLSRWVFVVPHLARQHADPGSNDMRRAVVEGLFDTLNQWGGVAIGEHLGQLLTCLWLFHLVIGQLRETGLLARAAALFGILALGGIGAGLGEGLALALGHSGEVFGLFTLGGYLAFTLCLIATGAALLRARRPL